LVIVLSFMQEVGKKKGRVRAREKKAKKRKEGPIIFEPHLRYGEINLGRSGGMLDYERLPSSQKDRGGKNTLWMRRRGRGAGRVAALPGMDVSARPEESSGANKKTDKSRGDAEKGEARALLPTRVRPE